MRFRLLLLLLLAEMPAPQGRAAAPEPDGFATATAAPRLGALAFRNTISLDQYMAQRVGDRTRFASLTLGDHSLSWSANGVEIPTERLPARAFARLFLTGTKPPVAEHAPENYKLPRLPFLFPPWPACHYARGMKEFPPPLETFLPSPRGLLQSRRDFLAQSALLAGAAASLRPLRAAEAVEPPKPFRIAMINSEYRFKSHAYHFGRRFMEGYDREGIHHQPTQTVVRMFNDKHPANDLSAADAARFHFERCDTVEEALGGRGKVDVDAVLLVIEHGDYPQNEFGQILYPRHEFFMQIVAAFAAAGRVVPVFVDKALSYDYRKARAMVDLSRKMKFGLMAGSSLPVTWRRPELELPLETPIQEGLVAFGYDRSTSEVYFFHALETLQCMMERRAGGETGVRRVTMLTGNDVWKAGDEGRWSWALLEAALARNPSNNTGTPRQNVVQPEAILVEYADGTKGAALNLVEQVVDFTFAGRLANRAAPVSTLFELPGIGRFFDTLVWNIEKFLPTGQPPYPVERTLLTSTLLDFAVHSRKEKGAPQESEFLDIRYQAPVDSGYVRGRITRDP